MRAIYLLIVISCTLFFPSLLQAQIDCVQRFTEAQKAYEAGKLSEVEGILKDCMRMFTPEERVKAYRLITLAHIFSDKLDEADESYAKLLGSDPDYAPSQSDPLELQYLHKSFKTWPTASFGLAGGPNLTTPNITQYHSVDNSDLPDGVYSNQVSFQIGVVGEYYFGNNYSISPQVFLTTNRLNFEDNLFDFSTLTYQETQQWLEVPIVFKRYFNWRKANVRPFISVGASASFLQKSEAAVVRNVTDGRDATGPDVNTESLRNNRNYSAIASIGIKKHFRHIHAFFTLSYRRDFLSQVNQDKRYNIPELVYRYGYIDNDYNTSYIVASFGISYALYNHKRKVPRIPDTERKVKDSFAKKKKNK
ncbi:MAG: porin family protein [Flammeovirgaceae bacterium]